jgi:hypothetical protein
MAKHREHRFVGQVEGDALSGWLNRWQNKKAGRIVVQLVDDFNQLELSRGTFLDRLLRRKLNESRSSGSAKVIARADDFRPDANYLKFARRVDRMLAKCSMRPRLFTHGKVVEWKAKLRIIGWKSKMEFSWQYKDALSEGLHHVVTVAQMGFLDRIRRCAYERCRSWLFAKSQSGKYCSPECQRLDYQTSETWKEQRRKMYRQNYQVRKLRPARPTAAT